MPTVCRYIVITVDASLETLVSADENCSHATTMTNPSSAPYTRPTHVKNGDNAPLCPSLTGWGRLRCASHMLPAATATAATSDRASSTHRPAIPNRPWLTSTRMEPPAGYPSVHAGSRREAAESAVCRRGRW